MDKTVSTRRSEDIAPLLPQSAKPARRGDILAERLTRARSANEITNALGLKPIKGRSGPKIAY